MSEETKLKTDSKKKPKSKEKPKVEEAQKEAETKGEETSAEKEKADKKVSKGEETTSKEVAKEPEEDANTRYMRLMADFQNYKKRVEKEKNDIYAFANEKLVLELLDVIDNFDRALAGTEDQKENEGFANGMNMIFKQLKGVLEKAGVKEIESLGVDFDPNFHNAVMMEDSEEYESGKITSVLQKGYSLNNKVIRPSMVKVAN